MYLRPQNLFCLISSVFFLANIPIASYAANVTISQTINAGDLTVVEMPTDINFPRVKLGGEETLNFAVPRIPDPNIPEEYRSYEEVGGEASERIALRDLRYDGGFRLQIEVSQMENSEREGIIPVGNIGVLTFHRQGDLQKSERVSAGGEPVEAPLGGDPDQAGDYYLFEPQEANPGVSVPVTILDGTILEGEGRIGEWETYPAFMLKLPADLPVGKYVGSVTYTFS